MIERLAAATGTRDLLTLCRKRKDVLQILPTVRLSRYMLRFCSGCAVKGRDLIEGTDDEEIEELQDYLQHSCPPLTLVGSYLSNFKADGSPVNKAVFSKLHDGSALTDPGSLLFTFPNVLKSPKLRLSGNYTVPDAFRTIVLSAPQVSGMPQDVFACP
jgi:hypothetical protein